jgi:cytochrome d ubiquinol oxidase subunit I
VGDVATRRLIDAQPAKFAAMELLPETQRGAPLTLGGFLIDGEVVAAIEIPKLASFLGTRDFDGEVPGLDAVPQDEQPNANLVHLAFQAMVGLGTALLGLAAWLGVVWWRQKRLPRSIWFWRLGAGAGIAAILAMETGWIVTEVGRQPWIVYGIVRTTDAVTAADGIVVSAALISAIYVGLGIITIAVLRRIAKRFAAGEEAPAPYGPGLAVPR